MGVTLAAVAADLRAATGASRVTVRGPASPDTPGTSLLAEALAPGVVSMADAPQDGIAEAPTYVWLRTHRVPLIQVDCAQDPLPPRMLTERYRVRAQMLGPLLDAEGVLRGTVSVHQEGRARQWTPDDVAALSRAVDRTHALWEGRADPP